MVFTLSNILIGDGGVKIKDSGTSLSSVGGISSSSGTTTIPSNGNFSGTQTTTISHSLGKIPKNIEFKGYSFYDTTTDVLAMTWGNYNSSGNFSMGFSGLNAQSTSHIASSSYCLYYPIPSGGFQYARGYVSAVSTTDFTITWDANSYTPYGNNSFIIWTAIA